MKHFFLFLIASLILFSCENKDKTEAAEFFERANYHFKKREYEKAYQFYSEAIEKVPDFADAYNNRGIILEKQGNIEGAIREYAKAVELDDTFSKAKLNLSLVKTQSGDIQGVESLLEAISKEYKDSAQFYDAKGQYLLASNKPEEAISALSQAIALGGSSPELMTNLGYGYYSLKQYDEAIESFEKALEIDSGFAFALNNLSATYAQLNQWKEALSYSSKAIDINDKQILFINTHTLNLLETNKIGEAKAWVEKAAKIDPENLYVHRNEAILMYKNGEHEEAIKLLRKIEAKATDVEFLYINLGMVSTALGDASSACKYYKKAAFLGDLRAKEAVQNC